MRIVSLVLRNQLSFFPSEGRCTFLQITLFSLHEQIICHTSLESSCHYAYFGICHLNGPKNFYYEASWMVCSVLVFASFQFAFSFKTFSNFHATHENENLLEFKQKKIMILFQLYLGHFLSDFGSEYLKMTKQIARKKQHTPEVSLIS